MSDPRLELGETYDPEWIPLAGESGGMFPVGRLPFCLWRLSDAPDETMTALLRRLGGISPEVKSLDSWVALIDLLPDVQPSHKGRTEDQRDIDSVDGQGESPLTETEPEDEVESEPFDRKTIADPELLAVRVTIRTFRRTAQETPFRQAHLDRRRINEIICHHYDSVRAIVLANTWTCIDAALESAEIQQSQTSLIEPLRELAAIRPPGLPAAFWQRLWRAWADVG